MPAARSRYKANLRDIHPNTRGLLTPMSRKRTTGRAEQDPTPPCIITEIINEPHQITVSHHLSLDMSSIRSTRTGFPIELNETFNVCLPAVSRTRTPVGW